MTDVSSFIRLTDIPENKIVHIVTMQDLHQEVENNDYMRLLKKVTLTSLQNEVEGSILQWPGKISCDEIDELLTNLRDMNFEYAVFWFEGNIPKLDFEEEFLSWAKMRTKDWNMMGHLLDKKETMPRLHEQIVAFNLKNLLSICEYNKDYASYIASTSHIHDDYTPLWIQGKLGNTHLRLKTNHVFDEAMHNMLSMQGKIVNVPQEVRDAKICCYVEDDEEQTLEWLFGDEFKNLNFSEQRDYVENNIDEDKHPLADFFMCREIVYISNTDDMPAEHVLTTAQDINTLVCPCSGTNAFLFANNYIDTMENIVWFDYGNYSTQWIRYVLENWNGKSYKDFYYNNKHIFDTWNVQDMLLIEVNDNKLLEFDDNFNTDEWQHIQSLNHTFLNIDVVTEYEQLTNIIKDKNVLLQFSNIYSYEPNYIFNKYHTATLSFYSMINELVKNNKNVYYRGDTPQGVSHSMINISRLGTI